MWSPVDFAINRSRFTLSLLVFLLVAGLFAYVTIPKEAEPDIDIPTIYVVVTLDGAAPEDAERLILRPLETQLRSLKNLDEMRSTAFEGGGNVILQFDAGFSPEAALADVRARVDDAQAELPRDAEEPIVQEINLSLFPVITATIYGNAPERTLLAIAREAERIAEDTPGVLAADISGVREDAVEVIVEPMRLESLGVSIDEISAALTRDNRLIAAGALENDTGRYAVKVPALIEDLSDLLALPITASQDATVTLADVATVRRTFKNATSITRVNGQPAVAIEISKRAGANLLETVDSVKERISAYAETWPSNVSLRFTNDNSEDIREMLKELQNSVLTAVVLVFVIMLATLGPRASLIVGMAIPASFLTGILVLSLMGLTVNIVVLFSLILAVGMLVDDAIIVAEFAERRIGEGMPPREAYSMAAKRMAAPVIAATLTRVAAFSPLLFWPGIIGQFMGYMPLTLIATLSASLVAALIFVPALGVAITRRGPRHVGPVRERPAGFYGWTVEQAIGHPGRVLGLTFSLLAAVVAVYVRFGQGVEFFPAIPPESAAVYVSARGNLSLAERDTLVSSAEQRLLGMPDVETLRVNVGDVSGNGAPVDAVGLLNLDFAEWRHREKSAAEIIEDVRQRLQGLPGIQIEVVEPESGITSGRAVQVELTAVDPTNLPAAARQVAAYMRSRGDLISIQDGFEAPGIDWQIDVDRVEAAKSAVSIAAVGTAIRLVTNGVIVADYRPTDADDEVDVIVRLPEDRRTLDQLDAMRVNTINGAVPIGSFVTRTPAPKVAQLDRRDGRRAIVLEADTRDDVNESDARESVEAHLATMDLGAGVNWRMIGDSEEQAEAEEFLIGAFGAALFLIFAILLIQFNRFVYVAIVLSAVVFATIGVLIGLLVMGQVFGVVMTGVGIVALAGVIVNNNIVLIDTYARLRREGVRVDAALRRTCAERARPVLLTAITAMLGVAPLAFSIGINIAEREITYQAPSTMWWVHLSTAIVYGLGFATILTLVVTPAALKAIDAGAAKREAREDEGLVDDAQGFDGAVPAPAE
jgi:multidrug efflux pump